ncbi:hypothetical protein KFL_004620100 [Klebsormidium nitens]|uniref:Protein-S-isoprenylcysteine O-methyltransferase n=1 Tax=Klebsormidium nitens TaxID=105231 RepID=A0A1Y1ID37_KLENI|nr:hypothetical protein KFL_004620100 [Klebsormidium nitens]|eukprot:GAQ88830.1 hypothetical protein KFL_004620100 [Klebsormidium nitens]
MVRAAADNGPPEGGASELPGPGKDDQIVNEVVGQARDALRGALESATNQALERGAGSGDNPESREEALEAAIDANAEGALGRGAASREVSGREEGDRWQEEEGATSSSRAKGGEEQRQDSQRRFETEMRRDVEQNTEARGFVVDEKLRDPNRVPAFAPEQLGGGAYMTVQERGGESGGSEKQEGRKLPKSGFVVDDLGDGGGVEVIGGGVSAGPDILTQRLRRSRKRLLMKMFQGLEVGVKTAVTDPMGAIALLWFFLTHQIERILDWTNTGVWYSRLLKLAGAAFTLLPPILLLVSYPLEWFLVTLNNILTGDPLASIGFGLQVALIYYPITFSVLAAIAGLEGTRQLAVSRVTNDISRPFTPQLMQLVGMAWFLIMVPGLLLYKTAIGWVGFMTAFYVSFFVKSAIARFVGYTVQRTEGDPQWAQSPANPREIDPEWRIMPRTSTRVVFGLSVVLLHFLVMLESSQWTKLFFAKMPLWAKLIHTIGALWLLTFCYYVNTHSSDFIREYFEQYVVPREIVNEGLYRYVRHPIYASYMLLFVAYAFAMRAPISAGLLGAVSLWYYNIRVEIEEAKLVGRFGQDYVDYIREVPYRYWLGVY